MMLTAQEAAKLLGVSKRMMYDLAAPHGPVPCTRYSTKYVRFKQEDIKDYEKSCQYTSTKPQIVGVSHLTASSPAGESGLQNFFRKAGLEPKRKPMIKKKQQDFLRKQPAQVHNGQ